MKRALLFVALGLLASCAQGGQPRTPMAVIERALKQAPGVAQPGKIIAREFAFARAVRDDGVAGAYRSLSADGASELRGVTGTDYDARTVWMSCDATLAVTQGRFRIDEETTGAYASVWQKQRNDSYRMIAHGGAPLPSDAPAAPAPEGDAIVVTGAANIEGIVADCTSDSGPALPVAMQRGPGRAGVMASGDYTLRYYCDDRAGAQTLSAWFLMDGAWEQAVDLTIATANPRC